PRCGAGRRPRTPGASRAPLRRPPRTTRALRTRAIGGRGTTESASCGSFYLEAAVYAPDLVEGRNIVVTGGGSGLGAEMARRFAELRAHAIVLGRRAEKLDEVVAQIRSRGGKATAISCDVRDASAVERAAAQVPRVDGLVNNAAGNFLAAAEDL